MADARSLRSVLLLLQVHRSNALFEERQVDCLLVLEPVERDAEHLVALDREVRT